MRRRAVCPFEETGLTLPVVSFLSLPLPHAQRSALGIDARPHSRWTLSFLAVVGLGLAVMTSSAAYAEQKRVAVLFGNDDYGSPQLNLNSPPHDVQLLSDTLKAHTDFEVLAFNNLTRPAMIRALLDARDLAGGGTIVFYYSGHAIQVDGENYLLPKGVRVKSMRDVPVEAVSVRQVLQVFDDAAMKVVILDSCRTNPFGLGGKAIGAPGLSRENLSGFRGTLISYAAAPGTVAYDGEKGKPSPFTSALVENMTRPDLDIVDLFIQTRGDLERMTKDRERGAQRSEEINSLTADHELIFVRTQSGDGGAWGTKTDDPATPKGEAPPPKPPVTTQTPDPVGKEDVPLEERRHIMVPGLRPTQALTKETTDALNNVILAEFQNDPRYVVVGGSDIAALLEQETTKQLAGCDDDSCLAEVGEALGADILAKTSLGAVGNSYLLSINLIDVTSATPMRRISAKAGRDDDFLIEAAQKAVRAVLDDDADNGVIVVGQGVTRPSSDGEEPFEFGAPPAWPFAIASGLGGAVAVGAAVTAGIFGAITYASLNVSLADPTYSDRVTAAEGTASLANISFIVAGTAAAVTMALGGVTGALWAFDAPTEGEAAVAEEGSDTSALNRPTQRFSTPSAAFTYGLSE